MTNLITEKNCKSVFGFTCAAILILVLLFVTSCSPVKQVLKDPAKVEVVGRQWEKTHPCINDSVFKYLPGTTVTVTDSTDYTSYLHFIDSLAISYNINKDSITKSEINHYAKVIDSLFKHPFKVLVTKITHDTVKVAIRDLRKEFILSDSLSYYKGMTDLYKTERNTAQTTLKKVRFKNTAIVISLILLVALYIFLRLRFKLKI